MHEIEFTCKFSQFSFFCPCSFWTLVHQINFLEFNYMKSHILFKSLIYVRNDILSLPKLLLCNFLLLLLKHFFLFWYNFVPFLFLWFLEFMFGLVWLLLVLTIFLARLVWLRGILWFGEFGDGLTWLDRNVIAGI